MRETSGVKYLVFSIWVMCCALLYGKEVSEPTGDPPAVSLPFPMGETLTYQIYWGILAVGESVATTQWVWVDNRWLIEIKFRTQSNGILASLYPVDDTVVTLVDPETLRPLQYNLDLNEGKNRRLTYTRFDWPNARAKYLKEHEDKEDEIKIIPLKAGNRDLVSFMYFLRQTPFVDKNTYEFEVLADYKIYNLTVKTTGNDKILLENYGKVKSLKLIPEATFDGVFVRSGKMELWLSADKAQLLTKLVLDTPFANVKILLKSVEGPGAETWNKRKP
jgi:hypothetical protein